MGSKHTFDLFTQLPQFVFEVVVFLTIMSLQVHALWASK